MFENPRRGTQARNFPKNIPKILDLKSSSEQIFSENWRWVSSSEQIFSENWRWVPLFKQFFPISNYHDDIRESLELEEFIPWRFGVFVSNMAAVLDLLAFWDPCLCWNNLEFIGLIS